MKPVVDAFWDKLPPIKGQQAVRLGGPQGLTALAPMQDVTTLPFMRVVSQYGAPDLFFTEYFRVHAHSTLEPHILASITENATSRPIFAQLIGEHVPDLIRTINTLQEHPIAGIDLNMGCPAPRVYKKNVGGGLLREVEQVDKLLEVLRAATPGLFTVKMRVGFDGWEHFPDLLACIARHKVDLLSVHGRTVKELYRSEVHYDLITEAVESVPCPVLANGNITSADKALWTLNETGATGVMIGRSAIRNPWIFRQCREHLAGQAVFQPTLQDVYGYIENLHEALNEPDVSELQHVSRLKKFLNFVGQSVDAEGAFLYDMRRVETVAGLFQIARTHLLKEPKTPFALEPYANVIARPNCETPVAACG